MNSVEITITHGSDSDLSAAARSVWGKSDRESGGWMPLFRHMSDSAAVASLLWERWLPVSIRRTISGSLPDAHGRTLFSWLAAAHDLGKCSPAFAVQAYAVQMGWLADRMRLQGLAMRPDLQKRDRSPHSHVSHVILHEWLINQGFSRDAATSYAVVPGGHHGLEPLDANLEFAELREQIGSGRWRDTQRELADWVAKWSGIVELLPALAGRSLPAPAQVLLTAGVIVADWIASDAVRFPYEDPRSSAERARAAWTELRLTPPWSAVLPAGLLEQFRARFHLPVGAHPRPVQQVMWEAAQSIPEAALMILEAPMGEGKTEAALLAAEVLAARFAAGGCFIALPTMATSDAMFTRVHDWIERLPTGAVSLFLAHGKAALNEEYDLIRLRGLVGVEEDRHPGGEGVAVALDWLSGRKKGVLSSFVVGTIDQILMGALKSRHLVLRHLALAGKVVIIDEVHAADVYMEVYLDAALTWLGAYRVPTILLSATLPQARRDAMVRAYRTGSVSPNAVNAVHRNDSPGPHSVPAPAFRSGVSAPVDELSVGVEIPAGGPANGADPTAAAGSGYPLLTVAAPSGVTVRSVHPSGRRISVRVETLPDDDASLIGVLRGALVDGGCVAVVRNTVARAQATAAVLRTMFGPDVRLVHSRFLGPDRMALEKELRTALGPPDRQRRRPERLIVVGTQVLEQSLDVDFDLLITDLAPLDLVLQRIGRLHRHHRPAAERGAMREPRCVLVGVEDWAAIPPVPVPGSVAVYGMSLLLRSLATLRRHLDRSCTFAVPDDIAPLVQEAYAADFTVDDGWRDEFNQAEQEAWTAARERRNNASDFALRGIPRDLIGWTKAGVGDAEDARGQARVRDGDDSIEVLVGHRLDGMPRILPWIDRHGGRELSALAEPPVYLAKTLARCTLRLPAWLCAPWRFDRVVAALEDQGYAAWQTSRWLKRQLVLFLDDQLTAEVDGVTLTYSREDGLMATSEARQ
jgi:CRISPR-associated endonuclease/helicase Cas3